MCPLTLTFLLPSWLANERHRNAWFLPSGMCSGQSQEGRTWPDRLISGMMALPEIFFEFQSVFSFFFFFQSLPGRPPLKVYLWAIKWRKSDRSRSVVMTSLVKSNSFRLLRAQPPNVSRNKTVKSTYSLFLKQILYSSYPTKNKYQNMYRPCFKTAHLGFIRSLRSKTRTLFLLQGERVQLHTMVLRSLANMGAFSPRWLIQSANSSVGINSLCVLHGSFVPLVCLVSFFLVQGSQITKNPSSCHCIQTSLTLTGWNQDQIKTSV